MPKPPRALTRFCLLAAIALHHSGTAADETSITIADASLNAAYYADGSCLLTVDALVQAGKTIIDANVDNVGSRMLIHCDTQEGRRLTLLARGDALTVAQRVPLLTREQIQEGKFGMIAWLTRSGVHYADDSVPRRFIVAGNVILRKSPPVAATGFASHAQRGSFAQISGILEPIIKANDSLLLQLPIPLQTSQASEEKTEEPPVNSESAEQPATATDTAPAPH